MKRSLTPTCDRIALRWSLFALAALASSGASAAAQRMPDCPLATSRYSADTPLIDLLLDGRARDILERAGVLSRIPGWMLKPGTPTFASILSLRSSATVLHLPMQDLADLSSKLSILPIRKAESIARCARYESGPPAASLMPSRQPAVLVFDKSVGYRDGPSVTAANSALRTIGARRGWDVTFTSSATAFTPKLLRRFAAVVWNNVSGDVLTVPQRRAFRRYIEGGGGFVGLHGSGGDPIYLWNWYADELVGARFIGHPLNPQFQEASVVVDGAPHTITTGLPERWKLKDEWYSFASSPSKSGARVLLSLDESTYAPGVLAMGDHPIAWVRCPGRGRSFYSAIGHRPEVYADAEVAQLIAQGIAWAIDPRSHC